MRSTHATMREMNRPPATYADVEAAPEGVRAELIDGELFLQAAPSTLHQRIALKLAVDLGHRFDGPSSNAPTRPGGWVLIAGPELWLGSPLPQSLVLCPDLAGWREARFPADQATHGLQIAPDWVCEVLSPSTQRFDRLRKADAYARAGVPWMWLVDPDAGMVEVYTQQDGLWTRVCAAEVGDRATLPPFGVELDLGAWWPVVAAKADGDGDGLP